MSGTQFVVWFAQTALGAWVDRTSVQWFAFSPLIWIFTRSDGVSYNRPVVLSTYGRKTGQLRKVVLPYFEVGEPATSVLAIVGSRGGMPTDPHWARNLKARPEALAHMNRRLRPIQVRLAEGEERARYWKTIVEISPVYGQYEKRAAKHGRELPVFLMTDATESSGS